MLQFSHQSWMVLVSWLTEVGINLAIRVCRDEKRRCAWYLGM